MSESIAAPDGWTVLDETSYARPLVASEAFMVMSNRRSDGHNDVCMGWQFRTSLEGLPLMFVEAIGRFRFIAPLVAADIVTEPQLSNATCWRYKVARDAVDINSWAKRSLTVYHDAPSDEEFIPQTCIGRLPYEINSNKQYFGCHLLLRPNGLHTFFIHGAHAIFDASPHLYALRHIFRTVSDPGEGISVADLPWGEEYTNLPQDLLRILGGPVEVESPNYDIDLPDHLTSDKPGLGLPPQRTEVQTAGRVIRVHKLLDSSVLSKLLGTLKPLKLSMTILFEAAQIVAVLSRNVPLQEDDQVTLDLTVIALQRFLPPTVDAKTYFTSFMVFAPLVVKLSNLHHRTESREQLLEVMSILRAQYDAWLSKPNLPYAFVVGHPGFPSFRGPHAPFTTNLGVVDHYVPENLRVGHVDKSCLTVENLVFGHRIVNFPRPTAHMWTFNSEIHLQLQATDIFDEGYLEGILDDIVRIALTVVPQT